MTFEKLIEFEAEITEVGESGVFIRREGCVADPKSRRLPTTVAEEIACGKRLYSRVLVTVELIADQEGDATP